MANPSSAYAAFTYIMHCFTKSSNQEANSTGVKELVGGMKPEELSVDYLQRMGQPALVPCQEGASAGHYHHQWPTAWALAA